MAHCVHFGKIYLYMVETEKGATAHELARNANIPSPFAVDSRTVAAFVCWMLGAHTYARCTGIAIAYFILWPLICTL